MLLTCINGNFKAYWYQDGYIRTSSKEFTLSNLKSNMVHLTNDAIQKKFDDYGKYEQGNKITFVELQRYIDQVYPDANINFFKHIYPQIKLRAQDSVKSVFSKINPNKKEHTFELFGLDYMIDDNF